MSLLIPLFALALCIIAAVLAYLASPQQQLRVRRLPSVAHAGAMLCGAAGATLWCVAIGWGAGVSAALTALMLSWVALPYFAWWLRGARRSGAQR